MKKFIIPRSLNSSKFCPVTSNVHKLVSDLVIKEVSIDLYDYLINTLHDFVGINTVNSSFKFDVVRFNYFKREFSVYTLERLYDYIS